MAAPRTTNTNDNHHLNTDTDEDEDPFAAFDAPQFYDFEADAATTAAATFTFTPAAAVLFHEDQPPQCGTEEEDQRQLHVDSPTKKHKQPYLHLGNDNGNLTQQLAETNTIPAPPTTTMHVFISPPPAPLANQSAGGSTACNGIMQTAGPAPILPFTARRPQPQQHQEEEETKGTQRFRMTTRVENKAPHASSASLFRNPVLVQFREPDSDDSDDFFSKEHPEHERRQQPMRAAAHESKRQQQHLHFVHTRRRLSMQEEEEKEDCHDGHERQRNTTTHAGLTHASETANAIGTLSAFASMGISSPAAATAADATLQRSRRRGRRPVIEHHLRAQPQAPLPSSKSSKSQNGQNLITRRVGKRQHVVSTIERKCEKKQRRCNAISNKAQQQMKTEMKTPLSEVVKDSDISDMLAAFNRTVHEKKWDRRPAAVLPAASSTASIPYAATKTVHRVKAKGKRKLKRERRDVWMPSELKNRSPYGTMKPPKNKKFRLDLPIRAMQALSMEDCGDLQDLLKEHNATFSVLHGGKKGESTSTRRACRGAAGHPLTSLTGAHINVGAAAAAATFPIKQ